MLDKFLNSREKLQEQKTEKYNSAFKGGLYECIKDIILMGFSAIFLLIAIGFCHLGENVNAIFTLVALIPIGMGLYEICHAIPRFVADVVIWTQRIF